MKKGQRQFLPAGIDSAVMQRLFPQPSEHLSDPVTWVEERLGERFWSKQREIAQSVIDHRFTAVKGCHGFGKSYLASRIAAHWIEEHVPGEAFVVSSAPTNKQVKAILWREISRAHAKGNLKGRITLDAEWKMPVLGVDQLVGYGRKPADHDEHGFQGIHELYVLVILDEACGVPKNIWTAMRALMTNENARALVLGNPDDPATEFAKCFDEDSDWNKFTVAAKDTPNFTGESVSPRLRQLLVTKTWVEESAKEWGTDNPLYKSKVDAEFSKDSEHSVFTQSMIQLAKYTEIESNAPGDYGVDVARFGESETVIYRNQEGRVRLESAKIKQATTATTGLVVSLVSAHKGAARAVIDGDGVGGGVVDRAKELGVNVVEFRGGSTANRKNRFRNRRSEAYWKARTLMQNGLVDVDEADTKLLSQMQNIRWYLDSTGRICVETKDEMRERGLKSPDRLDAFVYALSPNVEIKVVDDEMNRVHTGITGDLMNTKW